MAIFHFFSKEKVLLHLDIDTETYETEKEQLLDQGFERSGRPIHADNVKLGIEKYHEKQIDELWAR